MAFFVIPPSATTVLLMRDVYFTTVVFVFVPVQFVVFIGVKLFVVMTKAASVCAPFVTLLTTQQAFEFTLTVSPSAGKT